MDIFDKMYLSAFSSDNNKEKKIIEDFGIYSLSIKNSEEIMLVDTMDGSKYQVPSECIRDLEDYGFSEEDAVKAIVSMQSKAKEVFGEANDDEIDGEERGLSYDIITGVIEFIGNHGFKPEMIDLMIEYADNKDLFNIDFEGKSKDVLIPYLGLLIIDSYENSEDFSEDYKDYSVDDFGTIISDSTLNRSHK